MTPPEAPSIEEITVLRVPGAFYRPIAMNAYDDAPKGKAGSIRLVRAVLEDGTVGLGVESYDRIDEETISGLQERMIGTNPLEVYAWDGDRIQGVAPAYQEFLGDMRYAWFESALLDLVGQLKEQPVHALFGSSVRTQVDAYDGTLYFKDVELDRGPEVIGELAARIQADGYQALKMKVGRPYKWMDPQAGLERDIEAVHAAREAVGSNFNLMADANNGYQDELERGLEFLRTVGFSDTLPMADLVGRYGVSLVPHNWQSELGKLMGVHLGMIRKNVRFVEDDRWSNYALDASDYRFRSGQRMAPETSG